MLRSERIFQISPILHVLKQISWRWAHCTLYFNSAENFDRCGGGGGGGGRGTAGLLGRRARRHWLAGVSRVFQVKFQAHTLSLSGSFQCAPVWCSAVHQAGACARTTSWRALTGLSGTVRASSATSAGRANYIVCSTTMYYHVCA